MDQRMLKRMLEQAQKSQKIVQQKLDQFENKLFIETYGANHINVEIKGNFSFQKITINKDLLSDQEMLEEILIDALNEIMKKILDQKQEIEKGLMQ